MRLLTTTSALALCALVGAAALAAGTIAWMLAPKSVEVADDPALVLAEKTLPLERGTRARETGGSRETGKAGLRRYYGGIFRAAADD